jgi:pyruvate formate lyase activating enzyme
MKIAGLQKVSLIDYPEHIAVTVFLAGCNLNCGYCHNRWMLNEANVTEAVSVEVFLKWLKTRTGLVDGVCITGGEPTIHPELLDFVREIKDSGFLIKLDTNGTRSVQLDLLMDGNAIDFVAMDLKAPLDKRYDQVAGCHVDLGAIRESMGILRSRSSNYEFRTTVGPCLGESALEDIAGEILGHERWFLQLFESAPGLDSSLTDAPVLARDELTDIVERLVHLAPGVRLRGI